MCYALQDSQWVNRGLRFNVRPAHPLIHALALLSVFASFQPNWLRASYAVRPHTMMRAFEHLESLRESLRFRVVQCIHYSTITSSAITIIERRMVSILVNQFARFWFGRLYDTHNDKFSANAWQIFPLVSRCKRAFPIVPAVCNSQCSHRRKGDAINKKYWIFDR